MTGTEHPDWQPGRAVRPAPGLRRVLAPNPSPMTGPGTNSFILGEGRVLVIDPGPDLPAHRAALLDALAPGERVEAVLVTHAHLDHSGGARAFAAEARAPVLAFGDAAAGRSAAMAALAARGEVGGGEGVDHAFAPDATLADGEALAGDWGRLRALWTPGHFGNHLSFHWGDIVFSGDVVMGWTSTLISPPDGDVAAYLATLDRLAAVGARAFHPAHGAPVTDPATRLAGLRAHRLARAGAIRDHLAQGPATAEALARAIYTDTPPHLLPAAARNVLAHLLAFAAEGTVACDGPPGIGAVFALRAG